MTSKKALEEIKNLIIDTYGYEYEKGFDIIEKDLEVLEIFKKYLSHRKAFYKNQAQWSREEFIFNIESDNIWLNEEQREQYVNDFKRLKEWYLSK